MLRRRATQKTDEEGRRRMKAPERIASAGTMGREGATGRGRTAIISAHSDPENCVQESVLGYNGA